MDGSYLRALRATAADGQVPTFNAATGRFENVTPVPNAFGATAQLIGAGPHPLAANVNYLAVTFNNGDTVVQLPDTGVAIGESLLIAPSRTFNDGWRLRFEAQGGQFLTGMGASTGDSVFVTGLATGIRATFAGAPGVWVLETTTGYDPSAVITRRVASVATVAPLPAFAASGSRFDQVLTANANGLLTVDGLTANTITYRNNGLGGVLVAAEVAADRVFHGIWDIQQIGDAGNPWILRRRWDMSSREMLDLGTSFAIFEGATQAGAIYTSPPVSGVFSTVEFDWAINAP